MSALVVDDDDFTRVLLVRTLESTNVGTVTQASDAASAMRLADTERPSLAIVDLDLGPGPNGIDLSHGLRRLIPTIAIIILSSYQDPRLVGSTRPMPLGAIYVSKRSVGDTRVLEEAVAEVMTSPLAERASPVRRRRVDASSVTTRSRSCVSSLRVTRMPRLRVGDR